MSLLIDFIFAAAAIVVSVGVFIQFGLGYSFISFGLYMTYFAVKSASVHGNSDVLNGE